MATEYIQTNFLDKPVAFRKGTEYAVIHHRYKSRGFKTLEAAQKAAKKLTEQYCPNTIIDKTGKVISGTAWR